MVTDPRDTKQWDLSPTKEMSEKDFKRLTRRIPGPTEGSFSKFIQESQSEESQKKLKTQRKKEKKMLQKKTHQRQLEQLERVLRILDHLGLQ